MFRRQTPDLYGARAHAALDARQTRMNTCFPARRRRRRRRIVRPHSRSDRRQLCSSQQPFFPPQSGFGGFIGDVPASFCSALRGEHVCVICPSEARKARTDCAAPSKHDGRRRRGCLPASPPRMPKTRPSDFQCQRESPSSTLMTTRPSREGRFGPRPGEG